MATTPEERKAARLARQEKRQTTRATRKKYRGLQRDAIKKIRQDKDRSGYEKRMHIGATRAFHKVDRDGNVGGFKAFGEYSQKVSPAMTKRAERDKARNDRKAAAATAKVEKQASISSMKEKKGRSTQLKQDTEFFKRNAKVRGMSIQDYYAKYVK
jgi:hypothetical protein